MRGLLVGIGVLSLSTFNPGLLPGGATNLQQGLALALWAALVLATLAVRPILRLGIGLETFAIVMFYGFAVLSVLWSDDPLAAMMKGIPLAATTFCAYRLAAHMRIDDIVDCAVAALTILCAASLGFVMFVPSIGVDSTWMHGGEWQGVFESKQSLGTAAAILMFFTFHRFMTRGGRWSFAFTFPLALACVIGSGSRGGGAMALAACASLFFAMRSARLTRCLTFGPLLMCGVASVLIGFLVATGYEYIPLFGAKVDFTERAIIWQYALHHFGDRPFQGFGLNGFWSIDQIYHNFDREHGWVLDNYHDGYIAIVVETGVLGLSLFAASAFLFGKKMLWIVQHQVLRRADAVLVISLVNLIFFIDFTETFFLRSTNIVSILLLTFMFVAGAVPATGRRIAKAGQVATGRAARGRAALGPLAEG